MGRQTAVQQVAGLGIGITEEARRALLAPYLFPASILTALNGSLWVSLAVGYTASVVVGSEFSWGTIRSLALSRSRAGIVLGKWLFLMVVGGALVAVLVVVGAAMPFVNGAGSDGGPVGPVALGVLGAVGSMAFYATAALAVAVLSRSPTTPILVLAVILLGQSLVAGLPIWTGSLDWVPGLLPGSAAGIIATAAQASAGLIDTDSLPAYLRLPWPLAAAVLTAWVVIPLAGAIARMRRMDITE